MDINKCMFTGRIGANPELKQTTSGISVCSFDLAIERAKSKDAEKAEVDWLTFVAWRGTAEFVAKYLTKGTLVTVLARATTRQWEDREGNKRKAVEFVVEDIKAARTSKEAARGQNAQADEPGETYDESAYDGELPY